ncbi:MAG: TIGR02206 family membrane protein, partial [Verrucomicrobiae bacterium]|nr:TIGR02206 family membrane protein [Verrucomicrobiae bacterium]
MLMLAEFAFLGQGHIVVMFLTFVVPVWLGWWLRVCREERLTRLCFWLLAVALTANYFGIFLYRMSIGELTLRQALPMHLCDWVTIAVVVALVTRNRTAYELSYFWGLSGTLQAVITPNMQQNFPHPRCISFFVGHSGIVAAVLMLTLAASLRPHWRSVPKVLL